MKVFDITIPIRSRMPVYPGDPPVRVANASSLESGGRFNLSRISFGSHTGTHIDAPSHMLPRGITVDVLPLDVFIGRALVRHIRSEQKITCSDLESAHIPAGTQRLIIRTSNSLLWDKNRFQKKYISIEENAATWIVNRGIKLVGFDYLSIDPYGDGNLDAHRTLLSAGVALLEGLDLRNVPSSEYTLICLPLRLYGGDGAPVRALLMDERDWLRLGE